ncbi:cysteine peptidase family C39 domain-containing protein [Enterococcus rivorum]|uniref:hypothetical protein n=1 Tax=Enterococcus rivorum TaxID=762845 RepID=UPI003639755B
MVLFSIIFSLVLILSPEKANADFTPPEVENIIIQELSDSIKKGFTMQPTPKSIAYILNFIEKSNKRTPKELLKYVYPTYNDSQLNTVSANLEQSNNYLTSQKYQTKILKGYPDINLLKEELSNGRPVIAYLTANGNYWIEQETSIIIYGYQKITFPGRPPMILYMYQSVTHGKGAIYSGGESEIPLLLTESQTDPTANITFKWVSTLYGFNK